MIYIMKKKGFTLVELLAVIAILAILVIIALPNVMGMFRTAKKNSFTTELKDVFKAAEQQWMLDSMTSTGEKTYARVNGTACGSALDLSGRTELDYMIKVSKNGKITEYHATDGTYQYSYTGTELKVEKIDDDTAKVETIGEAGVTQFKITCSSNVPAKSNS